MDLTFPKHLYYEPEHHVWCLVESDQKIRLGIDPLGISSLGELAYLSLNPLESQIRKGQAMGVLEAAKMTGELIAPLSGSITERNREALENPYQVNQDPYGKGWLCVIECKDWETESKHLITGEAVEAWSEKEMERYRSQGWID